MAMPGMSKEVESEKAFTLKDIKPSELFGLHRPGNKFSQDISSYVRSLGRTPQNVMARSFTVPSIDDTAARIDARNTGAMKKSLNWFDLMNLGIGIILGAGVFVVTGTVANGYSGGATVMAYFIAGTSAFLSSLCYSEYAVEFPVAGGSFTFILYTFGEFWAWITATNLIFNYVLANAAVARSFAPYFGQLCDQGGNFLVIVSGGKRLDFAAFVLILVLSVLLCWGMKETKTVNNVITVVHVAVVIFIIIAGLTQAKGSNFTDGGWAPYGVRGVWNGASLVFFSYIGFDAIATTAEEVKNPGRDIPLGMTLALCVVTTLYLLCAITLTLMLPYTEINPDAAFSAAFVSVGMHWAAYIVAVGALLGITTGVMVGLLAVARAVTALGRESFIPPIFSLVSAKLGTPIFTTAILGIITAIIALFTAFDSLLNLVSVCTLFTFYVVAMGVLYRHYHLPGKTKPWLALFVMVYFTAVSVGLSVYYELSYGWVGIAVPGILWFVGAAALMFVPQAYKPRGFSVPLMPWIPAGSIILNIFLMSTLGRDAFKQWGIFIAVVVVLYFIFSLPNIVLQNDIDAPRRAEWDAQQAANKASAYTEEGGKGGYGEVELASADRPIHEYEAAPYGTTPVLKT